jgi:CheY-like chemotaxis protein
MASVLVADDDVDAGELLADFLRDEGHEVAIAHNGGEGFARVQERAPDLLLLDVEMPVKTGPEMAYAMYIRDMGLENVPVVLISGVLELPEVAAAVGTPYFIRKPYGLDGLLALVARALVERVAPRPSAAQSTGRRRAAASTDS